jgi:hypothetical protein
MNIFFGPETRPAKVILQLCASALAMGLAVPDVA